MPTYDYRCADGHTHERRVTSYDEARSPCSCGLTAQRLPAYSNTATVGVAIPPISSRMVPVTDGFTAIEEVQTAARKSGVEPPDLFAVAKERAAFIQKHDSEFVVGN